MFINPEVMTGPEMRRVDRWLEANGCGDHVAIEPIVVRGNVAEYVSMGRGSRRNVDKVRVRGDEVVCERRKLRIRIPLHRVA